MSLKSTLSSGKDAGDKVTGAMNLVVLDKVLEQGGQDWVENVNIIEQLLVRIVDRMSKECPLLRSKFIVRRLPTYLAPFINKNEYGILLESIDFTSTPPSRSNSPADRPGIANFGQIEIFREYKLDRRDEIRQVQGVDEIVNDNQAYLSHEIFKRFASAFTEAFQAEVDASPEQEKPSFSYSGDIQIVGPHLLKELRNETEISKLFMLKQPPLPPPKRLKGACSLTVNYLKSTLTLSYSETHVTVKPCLYRGQNGFPRANANILERLPLHHPTYLEILEGLRKGFLLFPTSYETLWTLQFWPAESHLVSLHHPSSCAARIFKLYATYCLSPQHFWETLNQTFLLGLGAAEDEEKEVVLSADFLVSSFLHEMEQFPNTEDWAPRNFQTRLVYLLRSAVDAHAKGFHSHYFTKINVLRGIWKSGEYEMEESSALRELDDIAGSLEDLDEYGERFGEMDDLADDFGFRFDELRTIDDDDETLGSRPNSASIYKSYTGREEGGTLPLRKESTISRVFGSLLGRKVTRRHSDAVMHNKPRSISDVAEGFEEAVAQARARNRPESVQLRLNFPLETEEDDLRHTETSFSFRKVERSRWSAEGPSRSPQSPESIYSLILQHLTGLPVLDYMNAAELVPLSDLEKMHKALKAQEDLISIWGKACSEFPIPKYICPHVFSPRQIKYLALLIQNVAKASPSMIQFVKTSKLPVWEISGDILRTVLHQIRTEVAESETLREKQRPKPGQPDVIPKEKGKKRSMSLKSKFSLKKRATNYCQHAFFPRDLKGELQLSLEEPEVAATNRLLEWLWNLRCSEIGRLSERAANYMEQLFRTSLINSHFLEQLSEQRTFSALAFKSAMAVTRIMQDLEHQVSVPLVAAAGKGWLWAEMILSLAAWNSEKGYPMTAVIPGDAAGSQLERIMEVTEDSSGAMSALKKKQIWEEGVEPDLEAATLAFHSELATPIGWNDFEDPRRPGPLAVPILIFSSAWYYGKWEMGLGNLVQVLVRLQKFHSLQHLGQTLNPPHRKTVLNEIRKLNKTLSLRIYKFDENVMSKTFKRLNSLRATRTRMLRRERAAAGTRSRIKMYTCEQVGCTSHKETVLTVFNGAELECTKL